jgi:chorismate mutase
LTGLTTLWYFWSLARGRKTHAWCRIQSLFGSRWARADTDVGVDTTGFRPPISTPPMTLAVRDSDHEGPEAFMTMMCRGVRGATTADANTEDALLEATRELLTQLVEANGIDPADVASVYFTATPDLQAAFPAKAARQLGWLDTALMCAQEMAVPGQPARCVRVLIHWNTERPQAAIEHVYLRGATVLRPDRAGTPAPLG